MREKSCVGALFMPQRFRMRQDLRFCGPLSSACAVYVWSRVMGPKVWAGLPCVAPVARCPGAQSRAACMVLRYAKSRRVYGAQAHKAAPHQMPGDQVPQAALRWLSGAPAYKAALRWLPGAPVRKVARHQMPGDQVP